MKENDIEILIYSGGKTASSTLYYSFKNINPQTFHTHRDKFTKKQLKLDITIDGIINANRNKKLLIVSCYREPISRHLSVVFEMGVYYFGLKDIKEINNLDDNTIINKFYEVLEMGYMNYHPHSDETLNKYVYIFKYQFNKEEGYQIYETPLFKWIYLRFDKINNFEKIIQEYTEYKNFKILEQNISTSKVYGDKYKNIKKNLKIPVQLLDFYLDRDLKNLQYFYTDEEIQKIKEEWCDTNNDSTAK